MVIRVLAKIMLSLEVETSRGQNGQRLLSGGYVQQTIVVMARLSSQDPNIEMLDLKIDII